MFTVYAIYNAKNKKIYIGQTKNLGERLQLHYKRIFKGGYTARYDGKWILIYTEYQPSRQDALKREKQLKSYRGREFIKKYIPG